MGYAPRSSRSGSIPPVSLPSASPLPCWGRSRAPIWPRIRHPAATQTQFFTPICGTVSFLQAPTRHKIEAKLRSMQGAARTSYRPDTLSRLHTNIEVHDWRSMSRSLTRASRAPQARCRQSILRRRRPRTCGRRCRAPRSWPPSAKKRSKKLSPSTTTSLETPVWAMPLRAPHGGNSDNVSTRRLQCESHHTHTRSRQLKPSKPSVHRATEARWAASAGSG